jgi:purine-nucleoside phosphorylase
MQRLGVEIVFLTNAAGGTGPHLKRGDIMVIASLVDLMLRTGPAMVSPTAMGRPLLRGDQSCDRELGQRAHVVARREGFRLHEGVYAGLLGPNYETRAEYRMLRRIGADAVGMSTVPEIAVATAIGLRVLAMSVISNVASPDDLGVTTGEEVIGAAALAAPRLQAIVEGLIGEFGERSAASRISPSGVISEVED